MKNLIFFIAATLLFGLISHAEDSIHLIIVNGVAERSVEPNMVVLQVESWGKATTAKVAQETQANQYLKIKAVFEKFKIKKEDFQTENFSVSPEYIYEPKTQTNKISGYRVSHQMSITYRKTDEAGIFIDALAGSGKGDLTGGVSVQNMAWDYDKKSVVENSAINDAVRSARTKAEDLAKAAGVKIKAVHRLQNNTMSAPISRPMYEMKAMRADVGGASTELSSGQIKVRTELHMEFEIQ